VVLSFINLKELPQMMHRRMKIIQSKSLLFIIRGEVQESNGQHNFL
jgi:hypothetical protein